MGVFGVGFQAGKHAPPCVSYDHLKSMRAGSVSRQPGFEGLAVSKHVIFEFAQGTYHFCGGLIGKANSPRRLISAAKPQAPDVGVVTAGAERAKWKSTHSVPHIEAKGCLVVQGQLYR